jgi:leucyl/phenylalanyl-tRNA--protein transferase
MSQWIPNNYVVFPDPDQSDSDGLVAIGGDLMPETILSAYMQGIFPWYSANEPILWWSPDPRMVLYPSKIRVSHSMKQLLKKESFKYNINSCFDEVIHHCAAVSRTNQQGTWITPEMKKAYAVLHKMGFAHSIEVFENNQLVGGLYGLSIGKIFFGESMFHLTTNASKAALIFLANKLASENFILIDVQQSTTHLKNMGAENIRRNDFLAILQNEYSSFYSIIQNT